MSPRKTTDPVRTFRVDEGLWREAVDIARGRGDSLSEILRAALEQYVKKNRSK